MSAQTVAILGASNNPERFAHKAFVMLREHGHTVIPVNPALESIEGVPVVKDLASLSAVDTLTLYIGSARLPAIKEEIVRLRPGRVIFNRVSGTPDGTGRRRHSVAGGLHFGNAAHRPVLTGAQHPKIFYTRPGISQPFR
ncbi:MAG TPA: CoA-binding protein [Verrucomicrobiales bacterium]|nr:CoA-binding protein [Verrucomicrobiales bacterium]